MSFDLGFEVSSQDFESVLALAPRVRTSIQNKVLAYRVKLIEAHASTCYYDVHVILKLYVVSIAGFSHVTLFVIFQNIK